VVTPTYAHLSGVWRPDAKKPPLFLGTYFLSRRIPLPFL
jgi:hypothetical protein